MLTLLAPLCAALAAACPSPPTAPADLPWPDYRGPDRSGRAASAALPTEWSETTNVTWKERIAGRGWSSPVVGDGRIWLSNATTKGDRLSVLAFDLENGERVLDRVLFEVEAPEPRNNLNSYASPSPCLGDGRVFLHFGTYGTVGLDAATHEELWRRDDLHCDHMEGPGSSPFLHGGRLILHFDGGDVQYAVALDAATGKTLWRTTRSTDVEALSPDMRKAYSTPIVVTATTEDGEREELISSCATATFGLDPRTGAELWRVDHPGFSMSSRPIEVAGVVVLSTGFMRPELWAIRPGGSGNVSETHVAWRNTKSAPTMPSPVAVGGRLFQVSDKGMLSCIECIGGETLWRERVDADVCASLLASGDRVYVFGRDGKTTIFRAADTFERLGECLLDDGCMASPAAVGDALILRTEKALYRIESPEPEEPGGDGGLD